MRALRGSMVCKRVLLGEYTRVGVGGATTGTRCNGGPRPYGKDGDVQGRPTPTSKVLVP